MVSKVLEDNRMFADKIKTVIGLRYEPVAVKLLKEGEEVPAGYNRPEKQLSHCQAMFAAKNGSSMYLSLEDQACHVGASALGMMETPEKVTTGQFHAGVGMHDSAESAAKMVAERMIVPFKVVGEVVCPLKDADFVPDIVDIVDIPEKVYWIVPLETAAEGGRVQFSTSPFQCCCEDVGAVPVCTGKPNISIGCFGCRKKTDMKADEMAIGIPYARIPEYVSHLDRYSEGVMTKAKRD